MKDMARIHESLVSILHRLGWDASSHTPLEVRTLRSGAGKRDFGMSCLMADSSPALLLVIPVQRCLGDCETLYSRYLDFDYDTALLLRCVEDSLPDVKYLLYHDAEASSLYDVPLQECLVRCRSQKERDDLLLPHLAMDRFLAGSLEHLNRKTPRHLASELAGWFHLWSAELGSRTEASRRILDVFSRKVILARLFRNLFGPLDPRLHFEAFLEAPEHVETQARTTSGADFLTNLFSWFHDHFSLDLMMPSKAEISFLKKADKVRGLLNLFLAEQNQVSRRKFSLDVLQNMWCSEEDLFLSARRAAIAEHEPITHLLAVSDNTVLSPAEVDVVRDGISWALDVFEREVHFWMQYNENTAPSLMGAYQQPDMFGTMPSQIASDGRIRNIPDHVLRTGLRIKGSDTEDRQFAISCLLTAKCFDIWKSCDLPPEPLPSLMTVFPKLSL